MPHLQNSTDVYQAVVEETETQWIFGLLTFAVVEEQRIEWMKHFAKLNGRPPDQDEVQHWYGQQPEGVLDRAAGEAENALRLYVQATLRETLVAERRLVEEGTIVQEVRALSRFWPQFGVNLAGGFASAVLFAAVLVLLAFFVLDGPSPAEIGRGLTME